MVRTETDKNVIYVDETERKPNLYAANVLVAVAGVISIVCLLNELGVFTVSRALIHTCLFASVLQTAAVQVLVRSRRWIEWPASKYVIMTMVLILVLTITILLNVHAVLTFVLPILLATQYRSHRISNLALIGSCVCCVLAPVLSYFLGTWSLVFLTGYIQTFCRVTIQTAPGNGMSVWQDLQQILLYWALPQLMTLLAFGIILYSATKNGIEGIADRLRAEKLDRDLLEQLASNISMQERALYTMSDIIESRDVETGDHVRRTSQIVSILLDAMLKDGYEGVTKDFCDRVVKSAPMHDLGKLSVPDHILRKRGPLTAEEYDVVKLHPIKSAEIINKALTGLEDEQLLTIAKNVAAFHHERMDGSGYPRGLAGKAIPLEARVMAIADVYDALVSQRYYKSPMGLDEAYKIMEGAMGSQFDADLNVYFIACRPEIEALYLN